MAVYTKIDHHEAQVILDSYDLGPLRSLTGITKGSVNTNYRVETSKGIFFLRIDERRGEADIAFEAELLVHLARQGFPTPEPLQQKNGTRFRRYKDKILMVFPFLPGTDKIAADYSLDELRLAGQLLGRLHTETATFPLQQKNRFGLEVVQTMWRESQTAIQELDLGVARLINTELDELAPVIAEPNCPMGIIHGDLFADNLLFTSAGEISGLLDFEAACSEAYPFDLATAINALAWIENEATPDTKRVHAILEGYESKRKPTINEKVVLQDYLRFTATRFTLTRIRDFVLTPTPEGGRINKDYNEFATRVRYWKSLNENIWL